MKKIISQAAIILSLSVLILLNANAQRGRGNERNERYEDRERGGRYEPRYNNNYNSRPSIQVTIGRNNGYYRQPYYYNPYPSRHFISPSFNFGFHLNILPRGYLSMNYRGMPYYYYNGAFMRPYNNYYEVVEAPIGAEVPTLPEEARPIVVDGIKYYEVNGNFFRKSIRNNGQIWWRVVGKNGRLDTDEYDDRGY